jgi:hypothetical protein
MVASDAAEAGRHAEKALSHAEVGRWTEAVEAARRACQIQKRYIYGPTYTEAGRKDLTWAPFLREVERAAGLARCLKVTIREVASYLARGRDSLDP